MTHVSATIRVTAPKSSQNLKLEYIVIFLRGYLIYKLFHCSPNIPIVYYALSWCRLCLLKWYFVQVQVMHSLIHALRKSYLQEIYRRGGRNSVAIFSDDGQVWSSLVASILIKISVVFVIQKCLVVLYPQAYSFGKVWIGHVFDDLQEGSKVDRLNWR